MSMFFTLLVSILTFHVPAVAAYRAATPAAAPHVAAASDARRVHSDDTLGGVIPKK